MKSSIRRRIETNRLYKFEANAEILKSYRKSKPLKILQGYLIAIWETEDKRFNPPPILKFGKGLKQGNHYFSYYDPADGNISGLIVLSPTEHNLVTLIHEIVHALGFDYHNNQFFQKEIFLISRVKPGWTEYPPSLPFLIQEGKKFKLQLPKS